LGFIQARAPGACEANKNILAKPLILIKYKNIFCEKYNCIHMAAMQPVLKAA
jgi:hypothetical protein